MGDPSNRFKLWSEHHRSYEDSIDNLGDVDGDVAATERATAAGPMHTLNCSYCGRQCKSLVPWGEVVRFFAGIAVENTVATRRGILAQLQCKACGKCTPMVTEWDEIRRWVDQGVRTGAVNPQIYGAVKK